MRHCRVHGSYYGEGYSGCPDCRDAEGRSDARLSQLVEDLGRPSPVDKDFGDYVCPHCRYKTLRRGASRCPECHGAPGMDFWTRVYKDEAESFRKSKEADEQYQLRCAAHDAKWWPVLLVVWVVLLAGIGLIFYGIFFASGLAWVGLALALAAFTTVGVFVPDKK